MAIATTQERPFDLFIKAISQAEKGISPRTSIREALRMTNLTSPVRDGWVMEDRMMGGPPVLSGEVIIDHFIMRWKSMTVGRLERKAHEGKTNREEEEVVKLMTAVLVVHQIRREDLCATGKDKINKMNRARPDLVLEVLDYLEGLHEGFPSSQDLDAYRRRVLLSAEAKHTIS
jgi:hypothetical protein